MKILNNKINYYLVQKMNNYKAYAEEMILIEIAYM